MSRKRSATTQPRLLREDAFAYTTPLPRFTSSVDEIKRAVEQGAVHRGELLIKVVVSLKIDELLNTIKEIDYDKEEIHELCSELNIDEAALALLDKNDPPIIYPLYFCIPQYLIDHPSLVMYYRNVSMLSRKVVRGIGLDTTIYEDRGIPPTLPVAKELSRYFNGIISKLLIISGVSTNRHIEIALSNIGDALGGISRNEVGRFAAAQILHYLIIHWFNLGYLYQIHYTLKNSFNPEEEEDETIISPKFNAGI